jgi:hypothetical protein
MAQSKVFPLICSRALTNNHEPSDLRVYITGDGPEVYEDTFMNIAKPGGQTFKPTLILVGTRLGLDKITPVYWEALKSSLQMPQSIGIAGYVFRSCAPLVNRILTSSAVVRHPHIISSASKGHTSFTSTPTKLARRSLYLLISMITPKKI